MITLTKKMTVTESWKYDVVFRFRNGGVDMLRRTLLGPLYYASPELITRLDNVFPGIKIGVLDKR